MANQEYARRWLSMEEALDWLISRGFDAEHAAAQLTRLVKDFDPLNPGPMFRFSPLTNSAINPRLHWSWEHVEFSRAELEKTFIRGEPSAVQAEFGQSAKVEQLTPKPTKPRKTHQRYPEDDRLAEEAAKGLVNETYPNRWQATKAVAPRAKGEEPAKLYRLYRKIDQAYNLKLKTNKTNQKI